MEHDGKFPHDFGACRDGRDGDLCLVCELRAEVERLNNRADVLIAERKGAETIAEAWQALAETAEAKLAAVPSPERLREMAILCQVSLWSLAAADISMWSLGAAELRVLADKMEK